jgi:MscS family membrane protein
VRFAGYGDCALKLDLRVYVTTREWNEFFAVREDIFLRIYDIVAEAGTGFAFPSQTLYFGRDPGLDSSRAETAESAVQEWRRSGKLPFPRLPSEVIDRLNGTLDYPPRGSADAGAETEEAAAEPLSRRDEPPESDETPENRQRFVSSGA